MTTYTQVRAALKSSIFAITEAGGYNRTQTLAKFCTNWNSAKQNKDQPSVYPKVFLSTGDIQSRNEVGRRKEVTATYFLTIIVLESADNRNHGVTTPAEDQIEAIVEDVEKRLAADYTLGGLVVSTEITSISVDAGFANPEGIAIFELSAKWHKQY